MPIQEAESLLHSSKNDQCFTLHLCAQFSLNFDEMCKSLVIRSSDFHRTSLLEFCVNECEERCLDLDSDDKNPGDIAFDIDGEGNKSGEKIKLWNRCASIRRFINHPKLILEIWNAESGSTPLPFTLIPLLVSQHSCVQGREPFAVKSKIQIYYCN